MMHVHKPEFECICLVGVTVTQRTTLDLAQGIRHGQKLTQYCYPCHALKTVPERKHERQTFAWTQTANRPTHVAIISHSVTFRGSKRCVCCLLLRFACFLADGKKKTNMYGTYPTTWLVADTYKAVYCHIYCNRPNQQSCCLFGL